MTGPFDPYYPTKEMMASMINLMTVTGIPEESIPVEWVATSMSYMTRWMMTTPDGFKRLTQMLTKGISPDIEITRGLDETRYEVDVGFDLQQVPSSQVLFYSGVVVNEVPIHPERLLISGKQTGSCDECGAQVACINEDIVIDPFTGNMKDMCNRCKLSHPHPRVNDKGNIRKCDECNFYKCIHHTLYNNKCYGVG